VREAIAAAGAQALYLPPYSPDPNPIELAFGKFKRLIGAAAQRTVAGLEAAIAEAIDRLTPSDGKNDFAPCGDTLQTG